MVYSPAARLLTALDLLQSRRSVTAAQLAERLEVEGRSVRRYILMLQDMGIPVEAERGRYGGYRLRPGYKLPPLMLAEDEALAVTLGLLAAERLGLASVAPAVTGALAKVERVLPVALREQAQALQETVALDTATPAPEPQRASDAREQPNAPDLRVVTLFSTAAYQGRRVEMGYRSRHGEETRRMLDPYGLAHVEGRWYVVGYCHLRQGIRVFRLDRVREPELRGERFTRPTGFDCLGYVISSFAAIPEQWLIEALLETTLEQIRWAVPPSFATLEETAEGVILRAYDSDLTHTARFLVGLGCPLRVRQPMELLDTLQWLAEEIAGMVARSRSRSGPLPERSARRTIDTTEHAPAESS